MTTTLTPATPSIDTADGARQKRAALPVAMFGFGVVALDAQITNVALPSIRRSLGGNLAGLQWIVTGYTLMFSALLLFGGSLADRIGSKKAYRNGMLLFIVASAACGLASSLPFLVIARVVQGVGAALVTPTSLSLIREAYEDSKERARAIAFWAMGGSVAAAAGPILGGLLTQVDWRLIFFVNLPVGAAALGVLTRVAPSRPRAARFDLIGQVTAVIALAALTYAFIEGGSIGFGSAQIIAAFVVAVVSFAIFQQQRGHSAIATGLLFLPMTGLVALTNPLVSNVSARFGRILPIIGGQLGMAAGLVALALIPAHAPIAVVSVLMIVVGVGGAFTVPPIASLVLDSVPGHLGGTASGVLNTFRQMGGSLGVAVFGAVVDISGHFQSGLRLSYVGTAILVAAASILTLSLRKVAR